MFILEQTISCSEMALLQIPLQETAKSVQPSAPQQTVPDSFLALILLVIPGGSLCQVTSPAPVVKLALRGLKDIPILPNKATIKMWLIHVMFACP